MSIEQNRSLPSGIATFLMTDVEGSTRLHAERPDEALAALRIHDRLAEEVFAANNGHLIKSKGEGDSLFAVFESAADALKAAVEFQVGLEFATFPEGAHLRARAALHTGLAEMDDGDYRGSTINRCARLRGIAHGGQTILSSSTKELVANCLPEGVSLRDMGMHRLKDLLQPEQVFQVLHAAMQADFPTLASLGNRPNNLPVQLTSFVGREKEIADVVGLLKLNRLVTLMGGGGTGKTRLSLQIGAELLDSHAGGVFFVELASITEPELVPHALANALRVREQAGIAVLDTVTTWLQEKTCLLICDNCEHVAEGAAKIISSLIRACPNLRILATSRQALHVVGESEYRVPSLTIPNSVQATAESIQEFESARLLLERARSKAPNFRLTDGNAEAVAQICARLDGIPLCLELVAPKLKLLTPEQLLTKLNDVFRVLTGNSVDEVPRHQTIQATVDWSYQLLTEEERAVLRWLSVFPAGCTVEAAEEACSSTLVFDILDTLSLLHDKSMITLEPSVDGSMRQRQLTTVRHFALEKLKESGESGAANDAMLSWCLHASKEANDALATMGNEEAVLDALNAEHANYRAALDWCFKNPSLAIQSLRLAIQLHRYLMRRGHYREAMAWLTMALNAAGTEAEAELRADGLNILGVIAWYQGQLDLAKSSIQESLALWRVVGNDTKLAAALNNSALLAVQEANLEAAQESLLAAAAIWTKQGDTKNVANAYANLGNLANEAGDYAVAISHLDRSLVLKRQLGDLWGVAMVLGSLAQAHMLNMDLDRGTLSVREALTMVRASNDETLASTSLIEAAYLGILKGQVQLAARLTGASDAAIERLGIELNVTHKRFRDRVVQAVNEVNPAGYAASAKGGRTLSIQKAVEEALEFVGSSELVSKN